MLTASAQQEQVLETLKAIKLVKSQLGLKTVLGVSNVSFGLPNRPLLNSTYLAAAFGAWTGYRSNGAEPPRRSAP